MGAITFDTLRFADKSKSARLLPEHAEAEALADRFEVNFKEVEANDYIKRLEEKSVNGLMVNLFNLNNA
ncbi:MAG: hypothetical protein Q8L79_11980 [Methylobacter sp.]|uniref:hypothetical protein n=1 Tax=Methylobacter sp. TaxID=2051955 RepID=UPI0027305C37|nr:hypothetical protein [Methylobacter sp.]MDP1665833.1 hypothetical protein [Methylobacter sp.]